MLSLRIETPRSWLDAVLGDFTAFLQDHAANERKVSQSALAIAVQHPTKTDLVEAMIDIAKEEFDHFLSLYQILASRGETLGQDVPDPYMGPLNRLIRRGNFELYLMDRLLVFGVVEARGCERFKMVAEALEDQTLKELYTRLAVSEAGHHVTYINLAKRYFVADVIEDRLDEILDVETGVIAGLTPRAALH